MNLIEELSKHGITERGNTSLYCPETGYSIIYVEVDENQWLQVANEPGNHPEWHITIKDKTLAEIRTHIEENFGNYYLQRNNIGVNVADNQPVDLEYVMERVRDHLYVYRDNKDFETKDTVTSIHDFLEKHDWSMDITDIETLRQESDEE